MVLDLAKNANWPLVSVNITTYNRVRLLPRCLDSVMAQTYPNMEIVIVDDASTDNTRDVVLEYQKKDNRIRYHSHEVNKGNAHARNTALRNCKGFYVAFMDDDDEWIDIYKISKQVKIFEDNKDSRLGLVCSSVILVKEDQTEDTRILEKPDDLVSFILSANGLIYSPTVMTRRDIMIEVGGFDTNLPRGIDSDFYRNCIVRYGYEVYIIKEPTAKIHEYGPNRMTPNNTSESLLKDIRAYEMCFEKYKAHFAEQQEAKRIRKALLIRKYIKLIKHDSKLKYFLMFLKMLIRY